MKFKTVDLPQLAWTTKRLADGTRRTYYYAWRGGPPVIGGHGTPEFIASYHAAHEKRRKAPADKLMAVFTAYKGSKDLPTNPKTRTSYLWSIAAIEEKFATLPLKALETPRINAKFFEWRDGLKCGRRSADLHFEVLLRVLNWARDRGMITWQPPSRVHKLYTSDRSECIWLGTDVAAMRGACSPELAWALDLALATGQRQGDLLKLTWSQVRDGWLTLKEGKTGARVEVPVTGSLATILGAIPRRQLVILTNSRREPWTESGFRASWRKAFAKAGLSGLHFHDLRGTAVVNLADAGCTVPEIAAITGHTLKSVNTILGKYWTRTRTQAANAVAKLEAFRGKSGT
jgi:integrase